MNIKTGTIGAAETVEQLGHVRLLKLKLPLNGPRPSAFMPYSETSHCFVLQVAQKWSKGSEGGVRWVDIPIVDESEA